MEPRSFVQGAVGKTQVRVPCPKCYQACHETKEGFACPTHGLVPKRKKP